MSFIETNNDENTDFDENNSQTIITIAIITNSITLTTGPFYHMELIPQAG